MRTVARIVLGAVVSMWACGAAVAQFQPGKPLPLPAPQIGAESAAPVSVLVVSVKGGCTYRLQPSDDPKSEKVALKPGMRLSEGAVFYTTLGARLVLRIGDTQELTIGNLTCMSVKQAVRRASQATTVVTLKYGELRADVDSTRIANDVRIDAPDVTLAVTGTSFFIVHRPGFPTVAGGQKGNTGRFKATYADGQTTNISGDQQTDSKTPNPAQRLSDATIVETSNDRAREADEKALAKRSVGGGDAAVVSLGVVPSTMAGNSAPPKDSQLKSTGTANSSRPH